MKNDQTPVVRGKAAAFINNLQFQRDVEDNIKDKARDLLLEVGHRLKHQVVSIDIAIRQMCEAAQYCADLETSRDEMLNALFINYDLKDPLDEVFVGPRQRCLEASLAVAVKQPEITLQDFRALEEALEGLQLQIKNLSIRFCEQQQMRSRSVRH